MLHTPLKSLEIWSDVFLEGFRIRLLSYRNFVAYDGHGVIGIFFFLFSFYSEVVTFVNYFSEVRI